MSLVVVQRDLFAPPLPVAIAHGCNARGAMGAGVAKTVRRLFPACYDDYRGICRNGDFRPGDVHYWKSGEQHVFNLCTQKNTGPCARLDAIENAMATMLGIAAGEASIASIHLPKIGCGLGGLLWHDVRPVIQWHADHTNIDLIVHDYDPRGGS